MGGPFCVLDLLPILDISAAITGGFFTSFNMPLKTDFKGLLFFVIGEYQQAQNHPIKGVFRAI